MFQYEMKTKSALKISFIWTRVSQLKICDFSGETFKDFEVL